MGERTQMLVTVKIDDKEKVSRSLHYQWGYGRVMLLDALHLGWLMQLTSRYKIEPMSERELSDFIIGKSTTAFANFPYEDEPYPVSWHIKPYHETLENMFLHSDQNDGYAHLIIEYPTDSFETKVSLMLHDNQTRPVGLARYVTRGNGNDFAGAPFQRRYRWLLEDCDIRLIEPERKRTNDKEEASTKQSN